MKGSRVGGLVLALALAWPWIGEAAVAVPRFGDPAVWEQSFRALPKWRRVLRRIAEERSLYERCLEDAEACPGEAARAWRELLLAVRDAPEPEQLLAVNRFANRNPYRTDAELYGRSDYWASPLEFLARSGDCEDFAIFKYVSLRLLGFAPERLRVLVVEDQRRGIAHAVLVVESEGRRWVLDNLSERPVAYESIDHYLAFYAVNERERWLYEGLRRLIGTPARGGGRS